MKTLLHFTLTITFLLYPAVGLQAAVILQPNEDVMTSAFFFPPDSVRGYPGDTRPVFRVSTDNAFGVGPETIYLSFDSVFNPGDYTGPVDSAMLSMESVDGVFGANADALNPFIVSAQGVNLNPLTSITDDTNLGGPLVHWIFSITTFFQQMLRP